MSPIIDGTLDRTLSFPRVSGDEPPNREQAVEALRFSPRERG